MRIFAAILLACLYAATCYAQTPPVQKMTKSSASVPAQAVSVLQGKVKSVTPADPQKGVKPEITVADNAGQTVAFLVKSTATIYDPDFKASSLDKIKPDVNVKIKYTTNREGVREAVSISELK